jgi:hypothetical protein
MNSDNIQGTDGLVLKVCKDHLGVELKIDDIDRSQLVGASLFESDIDCLFILFVSKSDSESDVYLRNRFGSGVTLSWSLLLLIIVCKLF